MDNFEKIIVLLENKDIDVKPFIELKKNELFIQGSPFITEDKTFNELIVEHDAYLHPENGYQNPFFMHLGKTERVDEISDITIYHYKDKTYQTIEEVLEQDDIIDSQKYDIIYRGFQQLSNEYKQILEQVIKRDVLLFQKQLKLANANDHVMEPRWLKKKNKLFWLLAIIMIIFNWMFLTNTHSIPIIYVGLYNLVFSTLVIFPFVKTLLYYYLEKQESQKNKHLNTVKMQYEEVLECNDKQIERLEKDLYHYYSHLDQKHMIMYLKKTNQGLIKARKRMYRLMKKNSNHTIKKAIKKVFQLIHLIMPITVVILMLLFFVL